MVAHALYHRSQGYELARQVLESLNCVPTFPSNNSLWLLLSCFKGKNRVASFWYPWHNALIFPLKQLLQLPIHYFRSVLQVLESVNWYTEAWYFCHNVVISPLIRLLQLMMLCIISAPPILKGVNSHLSSCGILPLIPLPPLLSNLPAIMVILAASRKSYTEKENAVHELLQLISQERVGQYLAKYWHDSEIEFEVSDIPSMITLTVQELLEPEERDAIYRKLYKLVPRFNSEEAK